MLLSLATAPDGQLDAHLAKRCREFAVTEPSDEEIVVFLSCIRDMAVDIGGASAFAMQLFHIAIKGGP